MRRMVKLQNMVNKTVGVRKPEYGVNAKWRKKGQIIPIAFETVEQMLWDEGFRRMVDRGILYINEMQDKIDLGLEPMGAKEPENIIVFNDEKIKGLLTVVPYSAFEREITSVTMSQVRNVVNYAIEHEIVDSKKCELLKSITGIDVLATVTLNKSLDEKR